MELSQALIRLGVSHDDRALAMVVERTQSAIRRVVTRLTGDKQLGEECVTETVLEAAGSAAAWRPRTADPERDARRWVLGISAIMALAMARTRRRARRRDARTAWEADSRPPASPQCALMSDERAAIMRAALARLPKGYGEAVAARYVDELDVNVAAARLGIPAATVKTRAIRGLSLLRRRLGCLRGMLSELLWPPRLGGMALASSPCGAAPLVIGCAAALTLALALPTAMALAAGGSQGLVAAPGRPGIVAPPTHRPVAPAPTAARVVQVSCTLENSGSCAGVTSLSMTVSAPLRIPSWGAAPAHRFEEWR